jgi:enoyl-CoA hydratase
VGDVMVIRVDDGKANALTHGIIDALSVALDEGAEQAKAVAVLGREGKFTAGFDLSVMTAGPQQASDLLGAGARMGMKVYLSPVPVVFGVTGHALAMGAILCAAADYRVGAQGAYKLGLNEVAIGMPVPRFAVELVRDRLAPAWFTRSAQHGEVLTPDQALAAGYLDEVVELASVEARALEVAAGLAERVHPGPFRLTRTYIRGGLAERINAELSADLAEFSVG